MFRGASQVTLDEKGRLAFPARYRERLREDRGGQLVATIDRECLMLYPISAWEGLEAKLMALPSLNPSARKLQRLMLGYATELKLDGHGRILLPPVLREFAGIARKAVLLGQGHRFELWEDTRWISKRDEWLAESEDSDLPAALESLSL